MRRFAFFVFLAACRSSSSPLDQDAQASPQALATPAPLSTLPAATASALSGFDAGPPPANLRFDRPLPPDMSFAKETAGVTLEASFRPADMPGVPKGPEIASAPIEAMRKKTEPHLVIDIGAGRARVTFKSGFLLPSGTELRGRTDRYGALLISPEGATYRVIEPGVLRSLLGERRLDASPMSGAEVSPKGEGHRFGMKTRKVDLVTRAGKGSFELAKVDIEGGAVLARMLASLLDAPQSTTIAVEGEVPVFLELTWATPTHAGFVFEATSLTKRTDLGAHELAVPPSGAALTAAGLPSHGAEMMIAPADVATLHTAPSPQNPEARGTLVLSNGTDEARVAWLEGVPIVWLAPHGRIELAAVPKGKYELVWRSFLGEVRDPPKPIEVPGSHDAAPDAGAP